MLSSNMASITDDRHVSFSVTNCSWCNEYTSRNERTLDCVKTETLTSCVLMMLAGRHKMVVYERRMEDYEQMLAGLSRGEATLNKCRALHTRRVLLYAQVRQSDSATLCHWTLYTS